MREVSTHCSERNRPGSKPRACEAVKVMNLIEVWAIFNEKEKLQWKSLAQILAGPDREGS